MTTEVVIGTSQQITNPGQKKVDSSGSYRFWKPEDAYTLTSMISIRYVLKNVFLKKKIVSRRWNECQGIEGGCCWSIRQKAYRIDNLAEISEACHVLRSSG